MNEFMEVRLLGDPVTVKILTTKNRGPVPDDWLMTYDRQNARFPGDPYDHFLIEQKAKQIGVAYEDYCRERDRIQLASGGFTREVWEGCTLLDRQGMMAQLAAMQNDQFDLGRDQAINERRGSW
jgi:hypothetical protein